MINKQKEGGFYASKAKLKELVVDMPDDKQEPNKDELSRVTLVTPKSAKVLPLLSLYRQCHTARPSLWTLSYLRPSLGLWTLARARTGLK